MKRQGHLFEKVVAEEALYEAAGRAVRGRRRKIPIARLLFELEPVVIRLHRDLIAGTWEPGPYSCFTIHEPKERAIAAAPVRDRILHHAIGAVLEPISERRLISDTYACRREKGVHRAVARAQYYSQRFPYVLKCDVRHYFASINHNVLIGQLGRLIKDTKLMGLLQTIVSHQPLGMDAGCGIPIGNLTSQYFANLYLGDLDLFVKHRLRLRGYVRYMDDFVLFSSTKAELWEAHARIQQYLNDVLRLELKSSATKLLPTGLGMPFLGFRVFPGTLRLLGPKWKSFSSRIRYLEKKWAAGHIGDEQLAERVQAMIAHVSNADTVSARRSLFRGLSLSQPELYL